MAEKSRNWSEYFLSDSGITIKHPTRTVTLVSGMDPFDRLQKKLYSNTLNIEVEGIDSSIYSWKITTPVYIKDQGELKMFKR